jgi:hypothetical protein
MTVAMPQAGLFADAPSERWERPRYWGGIAELFLKHRHCRYGISIQRATSFDPSFDFVVELKRWNDNKYTGRIFDRPNGFETRHWLFHDLVAADQCAAQIEHILKARGAG